MRTIAIMNQKGGVGKTTTAVNLSAALAATGCRVGLIDIDAQAHASLHLGIDPTGAAGTVYDLLTGDARLESVWQTAGSNLRVAPAHIDLAAAEVELADVAQRETVLRNKLSSCEHEFDYTVIDCPPSLGILTLNALSAADDVLLPLQPHFLALHGLSKLLTTIELVATRLNPRLSLAGVVFCMYESGTRLAAEISRDVAEYFARTPDDHRWQSVRIFETRIRRNIRLAEAPSFGQHVFQYAPESKGALDYRALAFEFLAHFGASAASTTNAG